MINATEYQKKVNAAILLEESVLNIRDVSNQGREEIRTITTKDGKEIKLRLYGR